MAGGMCGGGVWQGACVAGACMAGGVHGREACVAGGMHGRGACIAGGMHGMGVFGRGGMHGRGACVAGGCVAGGGHMCGRGCMHDMGHAWGCMAQGVVHGRYYEIRSMSWRYASYWTCIRMYTIIYMKIHLVSQYIKNTLNSNLKKNPQCHFSFSLNSPSLLSDTLIKFREAVICDDRRKSARKLKRHES